MVQGANGMYQRRIPRWLMADMRLVECVVSKGHHRLIRQRRAGISTHTPGYWLVEIRFAQDNTASSLKIVDLL